LWDKQLMSTGKIYVPILSNGGGVSPAYMHAFYHALAGDPRFEVPKNCSSHIGRCRNTAAADFWYSDCDRLLFIDADEVPTRRQIDTLLAHDLPVVCGIYYLKHMPPTACFSPVPGHVPRPDGLIEAAWCGAGFMCIKRHVFADMVAAFRDVIEYDNPWNNRVEWDFFFSGVAARDYKQEDGGFCWRYQQAGGKILVDPSIQVGHEGRIIFPIEFPQPSHASGPCHPVLRKYPVQGA
jgi:hypothetical protein